eukprot:535116-Pelagomonas_calceolata.AAC.6
MKGGLSLQTKAHGKAEGPAQRSASLTDNNPVATALAILFSFMNIRVVTSLLPQPWFKAICSPALLSDHTHNHACTCAFLMNRSTAYAWPDLAERYRISIMSSCRWAANLGVERRYTHKDQVEKGGQKNQPQESRAPLGSFLPAYDRRYTSKRSKCRVRLQQLSTANNSNDSGSLQQLMPGCNQPVGCCHYY